MTRCDAIPALRTIVILHIVSIGATLISPDGFFELDDEEDPPVVKEADAESLNERFPKPALELRDPESWRHHVSDLNSIGRALSLPEVLDANGEVSQSAPTSSSIIGTVQNVQERKRIQGGNDTVISAVPKPFFSLCFGHSTVSRYLFFG